MGLNPPGAGLRRIGNTTKSVAKASLMVQPGDELHVSDDVADQLVGARVGLYDLDSPRVSPADSSGADETPSAEEAASAAESAGLEDPGALAVPEGLTTIDDVLAWVGNDPDRARAAQQAETAGKKRKGLLGPLDDLLADAG